MSETIPLGYSADDFLRLAQSLLPPGPAWPRDDGLPLTETMGAISDAAYALHQRAGVLLQQESDPTQTVEMLADWEAAFGLPDPCTPLNPSLEFRRAALLARIVSQGGQSRAHMIALAAAYGYAITITEYTPSRFGATQFGQPYRDQPWSYVWLVTTTATNLVPAKFGASAFGDPYVAVETGVLECELRRVAPAHTILLFAYV